MIITDLPFNKLVGLKISDKVGFQLMLENDLAYTNHAGTVHAAALFALAEAAASQFLIEQFPDFGSEIVPVVRKSEIAYKKIAYGTIYAQASFFKSIAKEIIEQLTLRKRALFDVQVQLFDSDSSLVFTGVFHWFAGEINLNL
jgi:acyl-coenzyme A thioesterase PaaI-like protein